MSYAMSYKEITKKYVELTNKYVDLSDKYIDIEDKYMDLYDIHTELDNKYTEIYNKYLELNDKHTEIQYRCLALEDNHVDLDDKHMELQDKYESLENNNVELRNIINKLENFINVDNIDDNSSDDCLVIIESPMYCIDSNADAYDVNDVNDADDTDYAYDTNDVNDTNDANDADDTNNMFKKIRIMNMFNELTAYHNVKQIRNNRIESDRKFRKELLEKKIVHYSLMMEILKHDIVFYNGAIKFDYLSNLYDSNKKKHIEIQDLINRNIQVCGSDESCDKLYELMDMYSDQIDVVESMPKEIVNKINTLIYNYRKYTNKVCNLCKQSQNFSDE